MNENARLKILVVWLTIVVVIQAIVNVASARMLVDMATMVAAR